MINKTGYLKRFAMPVILIIIFFTQCKGIKEPEDESETVVTPVFSLDNTDYDYPEELTITGEKYTDKIYYTIDGSIPDNTIYSGQGYGKINVYIYQNTTIKAVCIRDDISASSIVSKNIIINNASVLPFNQDWQTYNVFYYTLKIYGNKLTDTNLSGTISNISLDTEYKFFYLITTDIDIEHTYNLDIQLNGEELSQNFTAVVADSLPVLNFSGSIEKAASVIFANNETINIYIIFIKYDASQFSLLEQAGDYLKYVNNGQTYIINCIHAKNSIEMALN